MNSLYRVGYYTLSDGFRYVTIPAKKLADVEDNTRRIHDDVDSITYIHKEPQEAPSGVYCAVCSDTILYSEIRKVTGDDEYIRSLCPGCGRELLEAYLPF